MSQHLDPAATVVVVRDAVSIDGAPVIETLMLRRNDRGFGDFEAWRDRVWEE